MQIQLSTIKLSKLKSEIYLDMNSHIKANSNYPGF